MQPLDHLLATFSPKNVVDFKNWVKTQGHSQQDSKLLSALVNHRHRGSAYVINKVFESGSREAYSSARRRLYPKVVDFLIALESHDDPSQVNRIVGYLLLVLRCLNYKQEPGAIFYLAQAEQLALEGKQLGLLDQILYLRVKNAERLNFNVREAVAAWEENNKNLQSFRRIEIAFAEIREELKSAKKEGKHLNVDTIIHDVFNRFNVTREDAADPEFMLRLIGIGRAAYISVKAYKKIEPFIERFYFRFKKANAFGPGLASCEIEYLYLLAHTYYRNRNFYSAFQCIDQIEKILTTHKSLAHQYRPKVMSLKAGVHSYNGTNSEAITIAQKALRSKPVKDDLGESINLQLNLAVYLFNDKRYNEAFKQIQLLPRDEVLTEMKGREWTMKKQMICMIIKYEMGRKTPALILLKKIQNTYADLWSHPTFGLSYHFLQFTQMLIEEPNAAKEPKFKSELNTVRLIATAQQDDLQAISFYCWLKNKITGGDYYTQLIERVRRK